MKYISIRESLEYKDNGKCVDQISHRNTLNRVQITWFSEYDDIPSRFSDAIREEYENEHMKNNLQNNI